jgi:hypothetical protein
VRPFVAAGREIRAVVRAETETHRHLRDRIVAVAAISVVVDLLCTVLVFLLERHAAGTDVKGISAARCSSARRSDERRTADAQASGWQAARRHIGLRGSSLSSRGAGTGADAGSVAQGDPFSTSPRPRDRIGRVALSRDACRSAS